METGVQLVATASRAARPRPQPRPARLVPMHSTREAAEAVQPRVQERRCTLELALDADAAVDGERQKLLSARVAILAGPDGKGTRVEVRFPAA